MSVVLDLGANIECNKEFGDFSIMGASLYKSLYHRKSNVALLNIGSEELKGNEIIKDTFQKLNEKKTKFLIFLVILGQRINAW